MAKHQIDERRICHKGCICKFYYLLIPPISYSLLFIKHCFDFWPWRKRKFPCIFKPAQGEMIDRIEYHVEHAVDYVQTATQVNWQTFGLDQFFQSTTLVKNFVVMYLCRTQRKRWSTSQRRDGWESFLKYSFVWKHTFTKGQTWITSFLCFCCKLTFIKWLLHVIHIMSSCQL